MSSINTSTISGNLARDAETKTFASGNSVTEFTVAVSDWFKPKEGDGQEITYWIRCKCWGKQGERLAEWCKKGDAITVTGKLVQEEWESEGKKQSKTLINVDNFVSGRKKPVNGGQSSPAPASRKAAADPDLDAPEDDIPF